MTDMGAIAHRPGLFRKRCSGVQVNPGDLVCGDNTGVIVVPFEHVEEVLAVAKNIESVEQQILKKVRAGMKLKDARHETGYHTLQAPEEK